MSEGYGVDIWCTDTLFTGRLARGKTLVLQALYRRLITPRGTLRGGEEESAYGLDLAEYVGAVGYDAAIATLPGLVRGELSKDDRVATIDVTATTVRGSDGSVSITLDVQGTLVNEDEDFELTVAVTEVTTTLLRAA